MKIYTKLFLSFICCTSIYAMDKKYDIEKRPYLKTIAHSISRFTPLMGKLSIIVENYADNSRLKMTGELVNRLTPLIPVLGNIVGEYEAATGTTIKNATRYPFFIQNWGADDEADILIKPRETKHFFYKKGKYLFEGRYIDSIYMRSNNNRANFITKDNGLTYLKSHEGHYQAREIPIEGQTFKIIEMPQRSKIFPDYCMIIVVPDYYEI